MKLVFDEQDANLFQVSDPRLRADALKHSILPRMMEILRDTLSLIQQVYEVDPLQDSTISHFPHFRTKRSNELDLLYETAFIGLGGRRKNQWPGMKRRDGKVVQILPFRLAFEIDSHGLYILLENGWLKGLMPESHEKLIDFHIDNHELLIPLCFESKVFPILGFSEEIGLISPLKKHYEYRKKLGLYDHSFFSTTFKYPVTEDDISYLKRSFLMIFPIYHAYIKLAKGENNQFIFMLDKLNTHIESEHEEQIKPTKPATPSEPSDSANVRAESKLKVMPAIRWQVFQRDKWRCVACGSNAHDDVVLHVDHIVPRSKGGTNTLSNYQTLCDQCNMGKSNRDRTDLRNGASVKAAEK